MLHDKEEILNHAIGKRLCVTAVYNRCLTILAPHSLFTRHGDRFLRAVTIETGGRKPREPKLGTFKLAGLTELAGTRRLFSAKAVFGGLEPPGDGDGPPSRSLESA